MAFDTNWAATKADILTLVGSGVDRRKIAATIYADLRSLDSGFEKVMKRNLFDMKDRRDGQTLE